MVKKLALTTFGAILYSLMAPSILYRNCGFILLPIVGLFVWMSQLEWKKKDLILYLWFFFCFNLICFHWLIYTFQEFGNLPLFVSVLLFIAFSLIIQMQLWPLYFLTSRVQFFQCKNWNNYLILKLSALLTLSEIFIPQQFTVHLGHHWLNLAPYLGAAPYIGVVGYSFISYLLLFSLLTYLKTKKLSKFYLSFFILFLLINIVFPLKSYKIENNKSLSFRVVQANIGNFLKVSSEKGDHNSLYSIQQDFMNLSLPNSVDLVIWPETSYPYPLKENRWDSQLLPRFFAPVIDSSQADLFFGGYFQTSKEFYNSAFLIHNNGDFGGVQNKHILLPFGETLPLGPFNNIVKSLIPAISLFSKGTTFNYFTTKKDFHFGSIICYEILDSHYVSSMLNTLHKIGPVDFLINLTNDSWYGNTIEPLQHLFLGRWRAIEFQIPIIRATNTGISAVIYPDGSINHSIPLNKKDFAEGKLSKNGTSPTPTPYEKWGYWPTILLIIILGLLSHPKYKGPLSRI